jgi:UDP-N-acetylglucosamine:LPS N-acetylglucosamine transferase
MKIFYAIQATGNGHISRAVQLYPYLKKYGEIDFFLSGSNASLDFNLPINFVKSVLISKEVSLFVIMSSK